MGIICARVQECDFLLVSFKENCFLWWLRLKCKFHKINSKSTEGSESKNRKAYCIVLKNWDRIK